MAERRVQSLDLRKAGASYRQIAAQLKVSVETAWSDVQHELAELAKLAAASAEDVRALELARLDEVTLQMTRQMRTGSVAAAQTLIRAQERRARLLGLDAPVRSELSGLDGKPISVTFGNRYKPQA